MNQQKQHWNQVYATKKMQDFSWYQCRPDLSLELITVSGLNKETDIIDVGGGTSMLVDSLLDEGYTRLAVLDLSDVALDISRTRLGTRASLVEWFEADVTSFQAPHRYGLWHDRAVFHFLTTTEERHGYVTTLKRTLEPKGTVIIATFALEGPPQCSGLDVRRYDERSMTQELGPDFILQEVRREIHLTPWETQQHFIYFRFQWQPVETIISA